MAVNIRRAEPRDDGAMARLYQETAQLHHDLDPFKYRVPDLDAIRAGFEEKRDDPDRAAFVAEVDGQVVGLVALIVNPEPKWRSMFRPSRTAEVGIVIANGFRSKGIGKALMRAAEVW